MKKKLTYDRIKIVILCFVIYFLLDFLVQITGFLHYGSYVGIKSFLPVTFGLLYGIYGIIGEVFACLLTKILLNIPIKLFMIEEFIIIIVGLGSWFLWHINSKTHKIRLRYYHEYFRYIGMVIFLYLLCGMFALKLYSLNVFKNIMVWGVSLSILVGIPINILYSGLMFLNPILPPIKENGVPIFIKNEIVYVLTDDVKSLSKLFERLENILVTDKTDMKRVFEIQNCIEEIYLRIINNVNDVTIFFYANNDITFSAEFLYESNKYNPFYVSKNELKLDVIGLKLIKHRALLATYEYFCNENKVHVVI